MLLTINFSRVPLAPYVNYHYYYYHNFMAMWLVKVKRTFVSVSISAQVYKVVVVCCGRNTNLYNYKDISLSLQRHNKPPILSKLL